LVLVLALRKSKFQSFILDNLVFIDIPLSTPIIWGVFLSAPVAENVPHISNARSQIGEHFKGWVDPTGLNFVPLGTHVLQYGDGAQMSNESWLGRDPSPLPEMYEEWDGRWDDQSPNWGHRGFLNRIYGWFLSAYDQFMGLGRRELGYPPDPRYLNQDLLYDEIDPPIASIDSDPFGNNNSHVINQISVAEPPYQRPVANVDISKTLFSQGYDLILAWKKSIMDPQHWMRSTFFQPLNFIPWTIDLCCGDTTIAADKVDEANHHAPLDRGYLAERYAKLDKIIIPKTPHLWLAHPASGDKTHTPPWLERWLEENWQYHADVLYNPHPHKLLSSEMPSKGGAGYDVHFPSFTKK
jgi:hypothetical protein